MIRSLYVRVFVAIVGAILLATLGFALVYRTESVSDNHRRARLFLDDTLRLRGESVRARVRAGEAELVRQELVLLAERSTVRCFVFAPDGRVLGPGEPQPTSRRIAAEARRSGHPVNLRPESPPGFFDAVPLSDGTVVVAEFPPRPNPPGPLGPLETLPIRVAIVVVAIAIVATILARVLTRPLETLRKAADRLASGDLTVRVADSMRDAPTELELLGRDFDRMSERIAVLLESKERLLRDVSHELRSPLARLSLALGLARRRAGDGPQPELDRIEREAERLAELVGHVLTLARLADDAPLADEDVELRGIVERIVHDATFEASADSKRVSLVVDGDARVRAPGEALRWAIENLVRNAIAYSPTGGEVTIRVEQEGSRARIRVRDHGPGVPEAALESIFRPFYRIGTDRDRKTGGAGVGLAITARVAERAGGRAFARNAEGGGLEAVLELPTTTADRSA